VVLGIHPWQLGLGKHRHEGIKGIDRWARIRPMGVNSKEEYMRISRFTAVLLVVGITFNCLVIINQGNTIWHQRELIRQMMQNPACGSDAPKPRPESNPNQPRFWLL
jgi:hypothetical protein